MNEEFAEADPDDDGDFSEAQPIDRTFNNVEDLGFKIHGV